MESGGLFVLPIRKRGLFSQDSFFQGFQNDYSNAVENVMDRWSGRSLLADQFANYRQIKEKAPEDSITASISDTKENYVIVLDLSRFVQGDITVRTVERNAVVQAKAGGNTFCRKYPLPLDTNTEGVTAAMSDEGIMTITAPKVKKQKPTVEATSVITEGIRKPSFVSSLKFDTGLPEPHLVSAISQIIRKESSGGERIIPLIVEDGSQAATAANTASSVTNQSNNVQTTTTSVSSQERVLPIMKRGQFFKDSFFKNVWNDFETAMADSIQEGKPSTENTATQKEVETQVVQTETSGASSDAQKTSETEGGLLNVGKRRFDRLNSYRHLRDWALEEDNQAGTVTKEATCYKVVLDVSKFCDGKLDVKATSGSLEVKGDHNNMSFARNFSLPGMEKPDQVTADLSTDGVLTVTAPL